MRSSRKLRRTGLVAVACASVVLAGCSDDQEQSAQTEQSQGGVFYGPAQDVGNGTARAFVTLDADGNPTDVGMRISESALDGLPENMDTPSDVYQLDLPEQASATAFEYATLDWNPHGHIPPGVFDKPHFDTHFYMVDKNAVDAVDPANPDYAAMAEHVPEGKYVPQDYATPPEPPLAQQAEPKMGVHWADSTEPMIPGEFDFTEVFINGTWDGKYSFMEPMMTREWLLTKPQLQEPIKQPQAYQQSGYYPTTVSVSYDDEADEYVVGLGDMVMRQAS